MLGDLFAWCFYCGVWEIKSQCMPELSWVCMGKILRIEKIDALSFLLYCSTTGSIKIIWRGFFDASMDQIRWLANLAANFHFTYWEGQSSKQRESKF